MIDYKEHLLKKLMLKKIKKLKEKLNKDLWTENNEILDSHLDEQRGRKQNKADGSRFHANVFEA